MKKKSEEKPTEMVKHKKSTKEKVAMAVIGTEYNIGSFYDEAAEEKLKKIKPNEK